MLLALWPALQTESSGIDSSTSAGSYSIYGYSASSSVTYNSVTAVGSYSITGVATTDAQIQNSVTGTGLYLITGYAAVSEAQTSTVRSHGSSSRKRREAIMRDDEEIMLCISRIMCIASNN